MIRLALLGPVELTVDGGPPPRELTWRKNLGLLAYLALSPRGRRSREHLIEAFWPDKDERGGRHSLNEALRVLRKHLPEGALQTDGEQVILDPAVLQLDTAMFTEALEDGGGAPATDLVRGRFMAGFVIDDSNTFEDWVSGERRSWARHGVDALTAEAEARLEEGDLLVARQLADRARELDPMSDAPLSLLMRCDALSGNPTAALAEFGEFSDRLAAELGLDPPARLAALAEQIGAQREIAEEEMRAEEEGLSRRLPLAGRGEQLKAGMELVRSCRRDGEPRLLTVTGPPGSGKTRLAVEVAMRAQMDGFRVAQVRCDGLDRQTELGALRALLAEEAVFPAEPGDVETADDFRSAVREAADAGPLLLWVDDAQDLDSASFEAVAPTERSFGGRPVFVLVTATTPPPIPELDALTGHIDREFTGHAMVLEPLAPASLEFLASRALPAWDDEAIDRLSRRLLRDTGGLPLLAVDLLHALHLGLEPGPDHATAPWPEASRTMSQTFPGGMPTQLVAAIRVGFRRLSPAAQAVLKAGAVLDGRFTAARLAPGLDLEPPEIDAALDELEWRRWLMAEPRGYDFVARLHRDVVVDDMLTAGQRQRLRDRLTPAT